MVFATLDRMRMRRGLLFLLSVLMLSPVLAADAARTQKEIIDTTVAQFQVEPVAPGRVFFVGFAGYGEQRVFAEEIKLAAQRVAERFGSGARTLLLINDRRDLTTYALANHDNLRYALHQIRQRMDPETDVLFLVLSSHGARNAMIEVSNTGMEPVGLAPSTLRGFLDEAGIPQRVIMVSACFSGAFVKPLANDHTIVLTAASKSRTSFGCSDDRHLTYFGEAFFQDSLVGAPTLRDAFETTRALIRERERQEGVRPSQPQSYFGPVVESRLTEIEVARRPQKQGPAPDR